MNAPRTITFAKVSYTRSGLEALSGSELVSLFNLVASNIGAKPVRKFADKTAAVRRTWDVLVAWDEADDTATAAAKVDEPVAPAPVEAPVAEAPAPTPAPAAKKERATRVMRFTFAPSNEVKAVRDPETLRGRCVVLLEKGATFSAVEDLVVEFDKKAGKTSENVTRRAYELVRIMHYYLGWGIKHDMATGIISLYAKKK
jgi:hypothetical protein